MSLNWRQLYHLMLKGHLVIENFPEPGITGKKSKGHFFEIHDGCRSLK